MTTTINHSDFPLNLYVDALVRLLDSIDYHDDNYHHHERLKKLQFVYSETAKHFAQPLQQDTLKVHPKRLEATMRTGVQYAVYCYVKLSLPAMVAVSIANVYLALLDNINDDPHPDMESFSEDLLHGNQQKHPFWRLMNDHLSDLLRHYGSFCGLNIMRSVFDFFQGCWIETHSFRGFPGDDYYPLFLRRLNGLGGISGGSLFPAENFDEKALFEEITTAIGQMEPVTDFINDLISFYKEFDDSRDQVNLVTNYCQVEGMTLREAFGRLTADTIRSVERLRVIFDGRKTPAVEVSIHAYVQGYVTFHLCDERYRMHEVYERSGEARHGTRFRQYYEAATRVGLIDLGEWAGSTATLNGFKESPPSTETPNGNLLGLED
ncbi:MAG: hypothetical protein M1816_004957 [Peltula sp. TS41687]|nr:MAG: hypothetical protein M1816_004957 [Peltula sp. TS41687]